MSVYDVYCCIQNNQWVATFMHEGELVCIEGEENKEDEMRNAIQSHLEILQFLRRWVTEGTFRIYTNNSYCISCVDRWIPTWIQKGFRIGHTSRLRPNTDMLVKLHSFSQCMSFKFIQHYDDYEKYLEFYNQRLTNHTTDIAITNA